MPSKHFVCLNSPTRTDLAARAAHRTLDARVDRLYQGKRFADDTERVQLLFARYALLSAPLAPAPARVAATRPAARKPKTPKP